MAPMTGISCLGLGLNQSAPLYSMGAFKYQEKKMEPTLKKLTSRKFLLTLFNVALVVANVVFDLGFDAATLASMSVPIAAFIGGESLLDHQRIKATQITQIARAEEGVQNVIQQANNIVSEKDQMIAELEALLADGDS